MLVEKTLWIVVADDKGAHIYKKSLHHQLHPIAGYQPQHKDHYLDIRGLAAYLADAHKQQTFDRLVLIAPHKLLGELRQHLNREVIECIVDELPKEVSHLNTHDLQEYLHKETRWF